MAEFVVRRIVPHGRAAREIGKRPRIPGPGEHVVRGQHRAAIDGRDRRMVAPIAQRRLEIGALNGVVLRPEREIGQRRFRAFRVVEDVGLVGPFVDGRAAEFREADGLSLRQIDGRQGLLDAAGSAEMWIGPPVPDILLAKDPGLVVGRVDDGCSVLSDPVGRTGVVPAVILAALDIGLQVSLVVDREGTDHGIGVDIGRTIPPVRDRQVIIDTDEVDVRIGPQWIHVEDDVVAAVGRTMGVVLRPIRRIADLAGRSDDRLHLSRQALQGQDCRIGTIAGRRPELCQTDQFRANDETVDAAGRDAELPRSAAPSAYIARRTP